MPSGVRDRVMQPTHHNLSHPAHTTSPSHALPPPPAELGDQVSLLKSLSVEINNEVDSQNTMLGGMGESFSSVTGLFTNTLSKMGDMLRYFLNRKLTSCGLVALCSVAQSYSVPAPLTLTLAHPPSRHTRRVTPSQFFGRRAHVLPHRICRGHLLRALLPHVNARNGE